MKKFIIIAMSVFVTSGPLMAQGMERMRKSAENINIDTSSLKKQTAAKKDGKYEIQPSPANPVQVSTNPFEGLAKAIATILKLLFSPNGDIEIQNPSAEVPEVEGILEDDQSEETYDASAAYTTLQPADYEEAPAQQPQYQQFQQPQAQQFQQYLHGGQQSGTRSGEIPEDLKRKALEYFHANSGQIKNRSYIGIVDFAAHSSKVRFFLLNVETGEVHAMHVAHGAGSDPDADGFATRFSNVPNSKASSLGFYLTGALYNGSHGKSMRLHGLSSTNSNVLSRAVVIHESAYVREANVRQGRSFGCLAVAQSEIRRVLSSLNGGALIYAGLSNSEF